MAKTPSTKTDKLEKYQNLTLHELETIISELQHQAPTNDLDAELRAANHALRKRLRLIKARVMEFEQTNDHHLLIYDSTNNFAKIAGRSVLFYALTIANRLHRRFSIKPDTDGYSPSSDGVISLRALEPLEAGLAGLNIFPDQELSDSELHFYKLPKTYTEEQINNFRSDARQDHARITNIIVPRSPIPLLYTNLLELNQILYHSSHRISDTFAREIIMKPIIDRSQQLLVDYLNFANYSVTKSKSTTNNTESETTSSSTTTNKTTDSATTNRTALALTGRIEALFKIITSSRQLRFSMANIENLRLISHRDLGEILARIVEVERISAREYQRLVRQETNKPQSD